MTLDIEDAYDGIGYEDAEGFSGEYEDGFGADDFDPYDNEEDFDSYEDAEAFGDLADFGDDDFGYLEDDEDEFDHMLGRAIAIEDEDEFFGALKKLGKLAWKHRKKIAKIAAPIVSSLPIPGAGIAGQAVKVIGNMAAEGADTEDMLDAMAEVAKRDPRAIPIVAAVGAKALLGSKAKHMSPAARTKAVKDVKAAVNVLAAKKGPAAIPAIGAVVKSAKRISATKGTPTTMKPKVVKAVARNLVRKPPALIRKLARSKPHIVAKVNRAWSVGPMGASNSFVIPGPARITISPV